MAVYTEQIGSPNLEDVIATFDDETGKAIISGTGATKDFTSSRALFEDYRRQIKSLTVEDGVTSLGDYICYFWSNCTNFNVSNTVKAFGERCFYYTGIKSFTIESEVETLGNYMFDSSQLETITIKSGITQIPSNFCNGCKKLTTVILPESITKIGKSSFANCTALTQIKLPPSIVSLDTSPFASSKNIEKIGMMQSVKGTLWQTFKNCMKLKEAYIPYGVTVIDEAFNFCYAVQTVTVPKSVTTIRNYAFGSMNNLRNIYILNPNANIAASSGIVKGGTICNSISGSTAKFDKIRMYGFAGSTAETYANNNNIPFVALGELKSIVLMKLPSKLVYEIGELLDLDGFSLSAQYEGANFKVPPDSITGFDSETPGEKTVILTYEGLSTKLNVTVSGSKELTKISITKFPKTSYVLMDSLDLTGLEVTAYYSDGSSQIVSDYSVSGVDTSSPGTKTVIITYESQKVSFNITVYDIKSIKIKERFGRNQYFFIGDENTGDYRYAVKTLTATYENGEERTISYGNFTETEVDTSKSGTFYTTVKYLKLEVQSPYTVYGSPFISNAGYPTATDVKITLDLETGLCIAEGTGKLGSVKNCPSSYMYKVKTLEVKEGITGFYYANYLSNITLMSLPSTIETITNSDMSNILGYGGYSTAIIRINTKKDSIAGSPWGQTKATIIWTAKPEKLNIVSLPTKTKYLVGDTFDLSGLECNVLYSNGKTYSVDGELSYSAVDLSEPGKQLVTISCTEDGTALTASFGIEIVAKITGIRISKFPDKVYYKIGDVIDLSGMEVVTVGGDGNENVITDYTVTGFDSSTSGSKTLIVSYNTETDGVSVFVGSDSFQIKVTNDGKNPFDDSSSGGSGGGSGEVEEEKTEPIKVTVHWINGEFADLTNENIDQNTLTLQESICSEQYFIFGGCVCNQITFQAHHDQFNGTSEEFYPSGKIEVYVEKKGTKIKIFTGEIDSAERKANSLTRNFIAYDYLYKLRNTDIARWYKNQTTDKKKKLTQKQFRDKLFEFLGLEQVSTKLHWDDTYVPDTNNSNEMNVVNILKDLCLQNDRFGWMNRDGKFEYLKLRQNSYKYGQTTGNQNIYKYYNNEEVHLDTFKSFTAKEGRIWFPNIIFCDPDPNRAFGFTQGDYTAQEAYDNNVYYNRNSFFVGNEDWLNYVWDADEYGGISRAEPIMKICYGVFVNQDLRKYYRAQGYTAEVQGNPLNMVGQAVELYYKKQIQHDDQEPTELQWYVHSYIMGRTLKIGATDMIDTYSANNAPFNSNSQQLGKYTPEISATVNRTRSEMPTISYAEFTDGSDSEFSPAMIDDFTDGSGGSGSTSEQLKKAQLRCVKRIKKADYDALVAAGTDRKDTLYFTFEES